MTAAAAEIKLVMFSDMNFLKLLGLRELVCTFTASLINTRGTSTSYQFILNFFHRKCKQDMGGGLQGLQGPEMAKRSLSSCEDITQSRERNKGNYLKTVVQQFDSQPAASSTFYTHLH